MLLQKTGIYLERPQRTRVNDQTKTFFYYKHPGKVIYSSTLISATSELTTRLRQEVTRFQLEKQTNKQTN